MRSKKIILTAHCIMNQNSVVKDWARARGAFPIAELLIKEGVGIMQLPCPELIFNGINRPPLEYADYNTAAYRKLCGDLLIPYVRQLKDYSENGYSIQGIIAVHNSPSCSISDKRGVFMEKLFSACEEEQLLLKYAEIPETYSERGYDKDLEEKIIRLLRER